MQNVAAEYIALQGRMSSLKEKRAVLVSKEADKERQRNALVEELTLLGVDVNNPLGEIARLEGEAAAELQQAKEQVDQFERELNEAQSGPQPEPQAQAAIPTPQEPQTPEPEKSGLSASDLEIA